MASTHHWRRRHGARSNGRHGRIEPSRYFVELAHRLERNSEHDSSKADWIKMTNAFVSCIGVEYMLQTGSSVDGTKVATPSDMGDVDVMLVTKSIIIPEEKLTYVENLPALVHIDGREFQKKLRISFLVDKKFIPAATLKDISRDVFAVIRGLVKMDSLPEVSGKIQYTIESDVGMEKIELYGVDFEELGLHASEIDDDDHDVIIDEMAEAHMLSFMNMLSAAEEEINYGRDRKVNMKPTKRFQKIMRDMSDMFRLIGKNQVENKVGQLLSKASHLYNSMQELDDRTSEDEQCFDDEFSDEEGNGRHDEQSHEHCKQANRRVTSSKTRNEHHNTSTKSCAYKRSSSCVNKNCKLTKETKHLQPNVDEEGLDSQQYEENTHTCDSDDGGCSLAFNNDLYNVDGGTDIRQERSSSSCEPLLGSNLSFCQTKSSPNVSTQNNVWNGTQENIWEYDESTGFPAPEPESKKNITVSFEQRQSMDIVPAFQCRGWPKKAAEWITRKRLWPCKTFIDELVKYSFLVIAKDSRSQGENDKSKHRTFRLSFSKQEIKLIQSMSEPQRMCIRILKAFQKKYLPTGKGGLKSYYWKTACLWVSEEKQQSFWTENNLLEAVVDVMCFMIGNLEDRFLPHYFVREMNLIHSCSNEDLDTAIFQLKEICADPIRYLKGFTESSAIPSERSCEISKETLKELERVAKDRYQEAHLKTFSEDLAAGMGKGFPYMNNKQFMKGFKRMIDVVEETKTKRSETGHEESSPIESVLFAGFKALANNLSSKFESPSSNDEDDSEH